jgi:surface-anchored protein
LELTDEIVDAGYGFLGDAGDTIYLLDEVQSAGIPWPGWSTERLLGTLPEGIEIPYEIGAVRFTVQVDGPGDVLTWATGQDGGPTNRYVDTTDDAPDIIPTAPSVHAHTAWAFTEPGDYHLQVTPEATTTTGQILSGPSYDYHVHVGVPLVDDGVIPELSIAVPTAPPIGATVQLTASRSPAADGSEYRWYRWGADGYEDVPGGADGTLEIMVSEPFALYYVTLVGVSGREIAGAAVEVTAAAP